MWNEAKEQLVRSHGGRWPPEAEHAMLGMSSPEWSRWMHDELGVPLAPEEISAEVVRLLARAYEERLPVLPGAGAAVRRLAARWPLGLASPRPTAR